MAVTPSWRCQTAAATVFGCFVSPSSRASSGVTSSTLLNYAGVKPDLLPYVCDAAPAKQGKYLPGSHIPIRPPVALRDDPPDQVLILPWNIADEAKARLADLAERGTLFMTAVPQMRTI